MYYISRSQGIHTPSFALRSGLLFHIIDSKHPGIVREDNFHTNQSYLPESRQRWMLSTLGIVWPDQTFLRTRGMSELTIPRRLPK